MSHEGGRGIVRFLAGDGEPRIGMLAGDVITGIAVDSLADLLGLPLAEIRAICQAPARETVPAAEVRLLAPVDGRTEVWAAGVTYERSRVARMTESEESADVYDRVYAAERPELFFKSAAWRVSGPAPPCPCARIPPSTCPSRSSPWYSTRATRSLGTPSATT